MRPGPKAALERLSAVISITSAPRRAREWLADIALQEGWFDTREDAIETADRWEQRFLVAFAAELSELRRVGRVYLADVNSSSTYMIQGASFIEPNDDDIVRDAKLRRSRLFEYAKVLADLTAVEFEAVCRGILLALRVEDVQLTPRSADEGIDFFGRLALERVLVPEARLPTWLAQLKVWLVGQAKHYALTQVSTPEVRELVGSVELAKSRAFSVGGPEKYLDLAIRACDPVVYLFFTTGTLSSYAWNLLESSGVVGMDGEMVAAFLADSDIGVDGGEFAETTFMTWLDQLLQD